MAAVFVADSGNAAQAISGSMKNINADHFPGS